MEQKVTLDCSVVTVLNGVELEQYIPVFENHAVNMELFVSLTEEDLKSMGIDDQNHRDLLVKYIKKFQHNQDLIEELAPLR